MRYWIRLWTEMLDDPKVGLLDDASWRVAVSLFLLAGEIDQDGLLGRREVIAWRLRRDEAQVGTVLDRLAEKGIVEADGEGEWRLRNFTKRNQRVDDRARQQQHRKAARANPGASQVVTGLAEEWSQAPAIEEGEGEEELEQESESTPSASASAAGPIIPRTPLEASQNREIILYQKVTGVFPGEDKYCPIIENLQLIRALQALPSEETLELYLEPFWQAWKAARRKDGSLYDPFSLVWLVEWAVGGKIPARRRLPGPAPTGQTGPMAHSNSLELEIRRLRGQAYGDP